jgi:putative hemin transport protein
MEIVTENLKERYAPLKEQNVRIREAAKQLGVSEVELLVLGCGENVTRLRPEFEQILGRIEELGYVMALSRNDEVVHERKGVYQNGSFGPHASLFVGKDIDLRIFLSAWDSAFAVTEISNEKPRYSLQFFGKDGLALHKIYLERDSNLEAYQDLVATFTHVDQGQIQEVVVKGYTPETELPDEEIDLIGFRQAWEDLKDTHEFFGMLKKFSVTRTQALRLAPSAHYATKVSNGSLRNALNMAAGTETSIMVFVGNPGIIQIHTGPVKNIVDHGPWINVLDPAFNLHLKEGAIVESWVVRKPTTDGIVTSLELFNERKELICTLFGERKPGKPELEGWRAIAAQLN